MRFRGHLSVGGEQGVGVCRVPQERGDLSGNLGGRGTLLFCPDL